MIRTCDARIGAGHAQGDRPGRWRPHLAPGTWPRLFRELSLMAVFAVIYEEIRDHLVQAGSAAAANALSVVHAEQALGLFRERAVQQAFIGNDTVIDFFNEYYGWTHFTIPILVLGWLLFRHPAHYARARTSLAVATAAAFVVFWLYPEAPPRLLPSGYGIVDTLVAHATAASGHFDSVLISTAGDQYASMPSVHVAWAAWCALAIYPVARRRWVRVLAVAYPLMTTLVVVATGNHYFLDVIAGALLSVVTWVAVTRAGAWLTVRLATRQARPLPDLLSPHAVIWPAAEAAQDSTGRAKVSRKHDQPHLPGNRNRRHVAGGHRVGGAQRRGAGGGDPAQPRLVRDH
jgi:membrane-associated phospholipid phosphatase